MSTVVYVNNKDLTDFDAYVVAVQNWVGAPAYDIPLMQTPGVMGAIAYDSASVAPRNITLSCRIESSAVSSRRADLDALLSHMVGLLELRFYDDEDRVLEGYLVRGPGRSEGLAFVEPTLIFDLSFVCPNPTYRDRYAMPISLSTSAADIPIGTAPQGGVVQIWGTATTPTLTYKDHRGDTVETMTFASLSSGDVLELDFTKRTVYYNGALNESKWTAGEWFAVDHRDGDYANTVYPSLTLSSGTGIYLGHRRWAS